MPFSGELISELESVCAPHLADLIAERIEPQLTLPLGESAEDAANLSAFIAPDDAAMLPEKVRKRVEQAVTVFRFLEHKPDASFADAFTSLLGPIDDAAKALLRNFLADQVPESEPRLTEFFAGDLSSLPAGEKKDVEWNGLNLRRLLVDGAGAMPIGVLRWTLNYAKSPRPSFGGIFAAIKERLAPLAEKDFVGQVQAVSVFRNRYVAHQERELTEVDKARTALTDWIGLLVGMLRRTPRVT